MNYGNLITFDLIKRQEEQEHTQNVINILYQNYVNLYNANNFLFKQNIRLICQLYKIDYDYCHIKLFIEQNSEYKKINVKQKIVQINIVSIGIRLMKEMK